MACKSMLVTLVSRKKQVYLLKLDRYLYPSTAPIHPPYQVISVLPLAKSPSRSGASKEITFSAAETLAHMASYIIIVATGTIDPIY